ncbi:38071_t:CDS:2 [Gigaspora margarita]|uniref:38071_t:CDS:1 n=1 Tax=Gigaspora margarita TaxID=4874 RepID=A0ABN7V134_GIGMA|nr:38071_t:CDS:2 [Gigaspora margarita]
MYQKSFSCKTRISGPAAFGLFNDQIINQLLFDIKFIPFYIKYNDINILIVNLESSENIDLAYTGPNYLATFTKKIGGIQQLIVQNIANENECVIIVYHQEKLITSQKGATPIEAWQQMTFLQNYNGLSLFGLENSKVQQMLQYKKNTLLKYNITDWDNFEIIETLFKKYLPIQDLSGTSVANIELLQEITKLIEEEIHKPNSHMSNYSNPKKSWIIPIPQRKDIERYNSSYSLQLGWALRTSNKNKTDRMLATEIVKELEDIIKDSELDTKIPTIKTVEEWIETYSEKLHKLNANKLLNNSTEDNSILQELSYNKETDKESNSILNNRSAFLLSKSFVNDIKFLLKIK